MIRLSRKLRQRRFQLAIIAHRSFRSSLIAFLAGIPVRVGFAESAGKWLLTYRVNRDPEAYEAARNLALIVPFGGSVSRFLPQLPEREDELQQVRELLDRSNLDPTRLIALAPGSVWETKRWPEEYWTLLAKRFETEGYHIVLVGGPSDRDLAERITSQCGEHAVNVAGKLSIPGSAELLRIARLLVSGDTAPVHLAVAVNTRVITIFGPTVPEFGFASPRVNDRVVGLDLECRPCAIHGGKRCPLGHHDCMNKLDPLVVEQVIHDMIGKPGEAFPSDEGEGNE